MGILLITAISCLMFLYRFFKLPHIILFFHSRTLFLKIKTLCYSFNYVLKQLLKYSNYLVINDKDVFAKIDFDCSVVNILLLPFYKLLNVSDKKYRNNYYIIVNNICIIVYNVCVYFIISNIVFICYYQCN